MEVNNIPPRNLEAEKTVIGAVLVRNEIFDAAAERIASEDFYGETNRLVWEAIEALANARQPIDAVTLTAALKPHSSVIGDPGILIADAVSFVPSPAFAIEHYAPIVRGTAILRRMAELGAKLNQDICAGPGQYSPDYVEETLLTAEYDLQQIAARYVRREEKNWREVLREEIWRLDHQEGQGIATGLPALAGCRRKDCE